MFSLPERRIGGHEHRRNDGEVLGDVVGDRKRRQRASGDEKLLADRDHLDELGRVAVEVHHVAGFFRGHGASIHRHADVGLRQRGGVVGAVAGHCHEPARRLFLPDVLELVLWVACARKSSTPASAAIAAAVSGLSPVIMMLRMPMRRSCAMRSFIPPLTMSFRWMTPSSALAVGYRERRSAVARDAIAHSWKSPGTAPPRSMTNFTIASVAPLRSCRPSKVHAAHAGIGRERNERRLVLRDMAAPEAIFLFRENDNRPAFGSLVRQAGQLRRIRQFLVA